MNIKLLTEQWIELLQNRDDEAAFKLYCEQIIPEIVPALREKFQANYKRSSHYKGLISLLGFTPETVILTYHFIQPEKLVILYTDETGKLLDVVREHTKIPSSSFFYEPFSEQENTNIYQALEASLKRFSEGSNIAIELTGGKKTMAGALAVTAGILNIDLLYIDYTEYMQEFRKPKPESTYIHLVENPMKCSVDLFGRVEIERAVEFFNIGKYDISQALFDQAASRMANPRVAEICSTLSHFYSLWNSFAFEEAVNLSETLLKYVLSFNDQLVTRFSFDLNRLHKQIEVIKQLSNQNRNDIMLNFYFCAERNKKNGQNDIAALLYYRTIESVFENALKNINSDFDRGRPNYKLLSEDTNELLEKYSNLKKQTFPKDDSEVVLLPPQVAMLDALLLLNALGSPLAARLPIGKVRNISSIRNLSVYAHGIVPITDESLEKIYKLALEALNIYIEVQGIKPIESYREKFMFMDLDIKK